MGFTDGQQQEDIGQLSSAGLVFERLIEIGRAAGVKDAATVRSMVAEAQDYVRWQREYLGSTRGESRTNATH
jgi:hypothetical protein